MSDPEHLTETDERASDFTETSSVPQPVARSRWSLFWFTIRMLEVRLRFIAVLVALGLVIGYWDTLQNYWDRWTRPAIAVASNADSDTEFYCPMDPSVVRPGLEPNGAIPKCPICGMPLSLRKKGEPMQLPPGIVGRVSLTPDRVRMAGIRTSQISIQPMNREVRTVGTVAYDESKQSQIVTRVGGYLEKLMVDRTFMKVSKGDPLAEIYSPELYAAIQELKVAKEFTGSSLAKLAREKISLLGIDDQEIDKMLAADEATYRIVIRSPADGYVIKKMVQQGANVAVGEMLFEIADLSSVWIEAEIFERDMALLSEGQSVTATVAAYPGRKFSGKVALIYPEMQIATRTNRVRFEINNADLLLKAGMYAEVKFETPIQESEPFHSILVSSQKPPTDSVAAIAQQSICPVTGAKLGSMGEPVTVVANEQTVFLCCAGCEGAIANRPDHYLSRIRTVTDSGVLAVPETAVIDTGDQKIVYIQRETGVFEGVEVKLGPKVDGYYSVISGLLPGDQVAAAGAFLIDAETRLNPAASAAYFGAGGGPSNGSAGTSPNTSSTTHSVDEQPATISPPSISPPTILPPSILPPSVLPPITAEQAPSANDTSAQAFNEKERANIAKLPDGDQALAHQQVLCPITENPLGSMGIPKKIMLNGTPILLCCDACKDMAKRTAVETLDKVELWKNQNSAQKK
jgi:Cu(I)/Ag(I) efflux system membrane fusion protein